MVAAACFTLALVHGFIWVRKRDVWASLIFALTAVGTGALAMVELALMRAETPAAMATIIRWGHVPAALIFISLVGFVRFYLQAGRPWLAWCGIGVRMLALFIDFLVGDNLNFRETTGQRQVR